MKRDCLSKLILIVFSFLYLFYGNGQSYNSLSGTNDIETKRDNIFSNSSIQARLLSIPTWAKTYGGSNDDVATSIQKTSDGGYIVSGFNSFSGINNSDAWVLKLNANGGVMWQTTYGGNGGDHAYAIEQTSDRGYITVGSTRSFGAGGLDFWVIKLDANGGVMWQKTYGGSENDWATSIHQTEDGGYIVSGMVDSFGAGSDDAWVIKLDANGAIVWQKTYGGNNADWINAIQQTSDGGYIAAGWTASYSAGNYDVWVLRLDTNGAVVWQKTYGGRSGDFANSVQLTSDGGYIVAGYTASFGAGNFDIWVLRLDSSGAAIWQKTYGGIADDRANSVQQTSDGGYIVAGYTSSFGAGNSDVWVLKLDSNGEVEWQKTYGGSGNEYAYSIQQTSDSGYIVAGYTFSFGAGGADVWVLKLDSYGEILTSCNLIGNTLVAPNETSITSSISAVTGIASMVTPSPTSAAVQSTSIVPIEQCIGNYISLQPFLGMKPLVDDSGSSTPNGIIEPDELIRLQGTLENAGLTTATNVSGLLTSADPIAIHSPDARYPDISSNDHKTCTACYVIVAPSANRPSVHWDFHVTEQVSADSYGPVDYNYTYHVGASFSDVPPSQIFYSYIEKMLHNGVTGGCTTSTYCPSAVVQRQSMAKFICAAMNTEGTGYCPIQSSCQGIFADVSASNPFCVYIEGLYNSGVVAGCSSSPLQYCPGNNVVRDAMAKFLCNAINRNNPSSCVPTTCTGIFTDVPALNQFCGYIEALYNASIISGCGTHLYCPSNNVSRDQMAKFLVNAFGLTL